MMKLSLSFGSSTAASIKLSNNQDVNKRTGFAPLGSWLVLLCASVASPSVLAEDFLMTTGDIDELKAALAVVGRNEQSDTIDLNGFTYVLDEPLRVEGEELFRNPDNTYDYRVTTIRNGAFERLEGSAAHRLLDITRATTLGLASDMTFESISFRNGLVMAEGTYLSSTGGGAIFSQGVRTSYKDCVFENNHVVGNGFGGAIATASTVQIYGSELRNNSALADGETQVGTGGAIYTKNLFVYDTLFENNRADVGGAVAVPQTISGGQFRRSLFRGNTATQSGGAMAIGSRSYLLINSTLSENSAGVEGNVVYFNPDPSNTANAGSRFRVDFTTIVNNGTGDAGANAIFSPDSLDKIRLNSAILASNGGANCMATSGSFLLDDVSSSIVDDQSCGTEEVILIEDLNEVFSGGLADNGGPTATYALLPTGVATDASTSSTCYSLDQRGEPRRIDQSTLCDIGAFELAGGRPEPDQDGDGVPDSTDNCLTISNSDQSDADNDGVGDICDATPNGDSDRDGVDNAIDNCPLVQNADQTNSDDDGLGDACDTDDDNDGVNDEQDDFPLDPFESLDTDGDGVGNNADTDDDGDGQSDVDELSCDSDPIDALSMAPDFDQNGIPDCVDTSAQPADAIQSLVDAALLEGELPNNTHRKLAQGLAKAEAAKAAGDESKAAKEIGKLLKAARKKNSGVSAELLQNLEDLAQQYVAEL